MRRYRVDSIINDIMWASPGENIEGLQHHLLCLVTLTSEKTFVKS